MQNFASRRANKVEMGGGSQYQNGKNEREALNCGDHRNKKSGGKEPAQPSIPEGILGFLSPDSTLRCTW
jgi:hypothetical protein